MKSDFDKELDQLLRGHGETSRRGGGSLASHSRPADSAAPSSGGNGHESSPADSYESAHLDADELGAYAENALPPSTRLRYASHLADCDRCRRIATSIALAANVAGELERRELAPAAAGATRISNVSWRERLAALFAPRMWQYAAPLVAVSLVGVIALFVVRQQPDVVSLSNRSIREETAPASAPPSDQTETATQPTTTTGTSANIAPDANSNVTTTNSPIQPSLDAEKKAASGPEGIVAPVTVPPPPVSTDDSVDSAPALTEPPPASKASAEALEDVNRKQSAPLPARQATEPLRASKSAAENEDAPERDIYGRKEETTRGYAGAANTVNRSGVSNRKRGGSGEGESETERQYSNDVARVQQQQQQRDEIGKDKDEQRGATTRDSRATQARNAPEPAARARTQAARRPGGARRADDETATDEREADAPKPETRGVAGRQFRRQGDAWVDTAYRSQAVTVIRRGSEQFRSLVADEPELARIARELGGQIVVVWKGRAYRIR